MRRVLVRHAGASIQSRIGRLVRKGTRLGLDVRAGDVDRVLEVLDDQLGALRRLGGNGAVVAVRFTEAAKAGHVARLHAALEQASISVDVSFACAMGRTGDANDLVAPYLRAGAFQPQRFDARVPAGRWDDRRHVAIVRETVSDDPWPRAAEAAVRQRLLRLTPM